MCTSAAIQLITVLKLFRFGAQHLVHNSMTTSRNSKKCKYNSIACFIGLYFTAGVQGVVYFNKVVISMILFLPVPLRLYSHASTTSTLM